jgi:acyl carrier protein
MAAWPCCNDLLTNACGFWSSRHDYVIEQENLVSIAMRWMPGGNQPTYPLAAGHEVSSLFVKTRKLNMSTVAERVKKIVVEHLGVDAEKVTDNASFIDDLGADSLDTVELVMAFEEEFSVEIPDDAAETILTVGDAVRFLEKNVA